jgi:hypothetical protein
MASHADVTKDEPPTEATSSRSSITDETSFISRRHNDYDVVSLVSVGSLGLSGGRMMWCDGWSSRKRTTINSAVVFDSLKEGFDLGLRPTKLAQSSH